MSRLCPAFRMHLGGWLWIVHDWMPPRLFVPNAEDLMLFTTLRCSPVERRRSLSRVQGVFDGFAEKYGWGNPGHLDLDWSQFGRGQDGQVALILARLWR